MSKFEDHQEKQFNQLINAIGPGVELSDAEARSLMWLAGWEAETVENIVSIFGKLRESNKKSTKK